MPNSFKSSTSERGFSFIDLMSVLTLAAIFVSLALPSLQSTVRDYRLLESAEELAAALNRVRTLAVSHGAVYQVQFSTSQNSYSIVNVSDGQQVVPLTTSFGSYVDLVAVPSQPIVFSTRGLAQGGAVVLASDNGERVVVVVDSSGKTDVREMRAAADHKRFTGTPDFPAMK